MKLCVNHLQLTTTVSGERESEQVATLQRGWGPSLSLSEVSVYDPGTVMLHKGVTCMSEKFCKAAGLAVFTLIYVILLFLDVTCQAIRGSRSSKVYDRTQGAVVL